MEAVLMFMLGFGGIVSIYEIVKGSKGNKETQKNLKESSGKQQGGC